MSLTESKIIGILKEHIYTLPLDTQCEINLTQIAKDIILASQPTFSETIQIQAVGDAEFDGTVKVTPKHEKKLRGHKDIVLNMLRKHGWMTPKQMERATGLSWAQINPRLRDLRKPKFGGYNIPQEPVKDGIHRYRLLSPQTV